jgi:molybdopterin molybdotransferase
MEEERVPALASIGRVLSRPVLARAPLPPWDNSAMDGYAVRHQDVEGASRKTPARLRVVGEVLAGEVAGRALGEGEAIRIMTGAPVPPGADTIVRVEDTDAEATPGEVKILGQPARGSDVRPGGQDMQAGEEVLPAGVRLGPGQMGLLAATGASHVRVHERPRVAILSNGDELAPVQEFHRVLNGKSIPETNAHSLAAAVTLAGGVPLHLGIARDTEESILEKTGKAREAEVDILVTSGGASMGEHDLFKRVLDGIGFELDFWRVKMRPGTPFSFGKLPATEGGKPLPVFGLPGNPASSFVTFQVFCRPFLLRTAGQTRIHRRTLSARAGEALRSPSRLTHFFRVTLGENGGIPEVFLTGPQTSGLVRGQGLAEGLAVVPEGVETIEKGEEVRVVLLDDFGLGGSGPGYLPG